MVALGERQQASCPLSQHQEKASLCSQLCIPEAGFNAKAVQSRLTFYTEAGYGHGADPEGHLLPAKRRSGEEWTRPESHDTAAKMSLHLTLSLFFHLFITSKLTPVNKYRGKMPNLSSKSTYVSSFWLFWLTGKQNLNIFNLQSDKVNKWVYFRSQNTKISMQVALIGIFYQTWVNSSVTGISRLIFLILITAIQEVSTQSRRGQKGQHAAMCSFWGYF